MIVFDNICHLGHLSVLSMCFLGCSDISSNYNDGNLTLTCKIAYFMINYTVRFGLNRFG